MGFLDWLWGKRKREVKSNAGPAFLDDVAIDGKPGQKALVFGDLESAMRMAESMEPEMRMESMKALLYTFQHVLLRDAAFQNHPELMRDLADPRTLPFTHFWSKAWLDCERAGLLYIDMDDDSAMEAQDELCRALKINRYQRSGYTIYVVTMPSPNATPQAHFIAIVHKDSEPHEHMLVSPSTQYYTLEKTDISERPLLCEWRRDESRENYGEGPAPDLEAFAEAVFKRVLCSQSFPNNEAAGAIHNEGWECSRCQTWNSAGSRACYKCRSNT